MDVLLFRSWEESSPNPSHERGFYVSMWAEARIAELRPSGMKLHENKGEK